VAAAVGPAASLRAGTSVAGGGSLPGEGLESVLVEADPAPAGAAAVLARLRAGDPPVVARAERGRVVLDLRTVPPEQDTLVARALSAALQPPAAPARPPGHSSPAPAAPAQPPGPPPA
jgi:L-seryl-tRNA(Ser) seleniumtransferase